jgi:hypothetical protein
MVFALVSGNPTSVPSLARLLVLLPCLLLVEAIYVAMTLDAESSLTTKIASPVCFLLGLAIAIALRRRRVADLRRGDASPAVKADVPLAVLLPIAGVVGVIIGKVFVDGLSLNIVVPPAQVLFGFVIGALATVLWERLTDRLPE